ncbi:MAG: ComF family protein [Candidatus Aminicenantaceae bacterium]
MISSFPRLLTTIGKLGELIFFPSSCKLCSSLLEFPHENVICRACWGKIRAPRQSFCLCCGRFFEGVAEPHFCRSCLQGRPPFSLHRSCGRYKGTLKDIILLFKYRHFKLLGKELARFTYEISNRYKDLWWNVEALIPVPLHRKREKQRGFNQALIIAKELAKNMEIPIVERALVKVRNVPPQTLIKPGDREKNVSGAFCVVKKEQVRGKSVLLVDDVYTTGATIRECSRALREAGVREVRALSVAQA